MSAPLVSIVIPCFNAEPWVGAAIASALDQTHSHTEVVVIDDGSTDGSIQTIQTFGERIRWESGPNRGGCAARNRGLELSKGQWIQFLDADDLLTPTAVAEKLDFVTTAGGVPCSAVSILDAPSAASVPKYWSQERYTFETIVSLGAPQTAAPLHRRKDLEAVGGFRPGLPCSQEYDLHLRLHLATGRDFVSNRKVGVLIRPTPGSVSRTAGLRMARTAAEVLLHAATIATESGKHHSAQQALFAQRIVTLARKLWRAGQRGEARRLATAAQALSRDWSGPLAYASASSARCARAVGFSNFERLHSLWRLIIRRPLDPTERRRS